MKYFVLFFFFFCISRTVFSAAEYFIAGHGDDTADGSRDTPWRSIDHALQKISPGDTLTLFPGTYQTAGNRLELSGTTLRPVTIRSKPDTTAVITGIQEKITWQCVCKDKGIYRSTQKFAPRFCGMWLTEYDIQLVQYAAYADLSSDNYTIVSGLPHYIGPGFHLHNDGYVYIRLMQNPHDCEDSSGKKLPPVPKDTDPAKNAITVFTTHTLFNIRSSSYVIFENISFAYASYLFDFGENVKNFTFSNCAFNFGQYGMVLRGTEHFLFHNCAFNNGFPPWLYWCDIKSKDEAKAAPQFQSFALSGIFSGFSVRYCLFRNTMDSILIASGSHNVLIMSNIFFRHRDDCINIDPAVSNVHIQHNIMQEVMAGIAVLGGNSPSAGEVYIHHNIIDASAPQRGARNGSMRSAKWPRWTTVGPFSAHDSGYRDAWWKVYNNTLIAGPSGYQNAGCGPHGVKGNPQKIFINNIVYVKGDRCIYAGEDGADGGLYDGNILFREPGGHTPLFYRFYTRQIHTTFDSFRTSAENIWEQNGLYCNPLFSKPVFCTLPSDFTAVWISYLPRCRDVFTPGASYEGLNLPHTKNVSYRGAVQ